MKELLSLPLTAGTMEGYPDLPAALAGCGCQGIEGIWGGEDLAPVPQETRVGYHLTFWPDWVDFWNGDRAALTEKFGGEPAWTAFYGGRDGRETLLRIFSQDLDRARDWGAEYVVFHVSDVSIEEGYTYRWRHTDQQVLQAAAECIGLMLKGREESFAFLVENQWWPGFSFTDPARTEWLLSSIPWEKKGIMLDTGHLMNADWALRTQEEGVAWVLEQLDRHGGLAGQVRGLHLHQSLSGAYVQENTGFLPPDLPEDYTERFCRSYEHILKIDTHSPWTSPAVRAVVDRVRPEWLVHELSAASRAEREERVKIQRRALGWG